MKWKPLLIAGTIAAAVVVISPSNANAGDFSFGISIGGHAVVPQPVYACPPPVYVPVVPRIYVPRPVYRPGFNVYYSHPAPRHRHHKHHTHHYKPQRHHHHGGIHAHVGSRPRGYGRSSCGR